MMIGYNILLMLGYKDVDSDNLSTLNSFSISHL